MKVLHLSYVKQIAGAERHLLHLLPGLRREGIDIHMLILSAESAPPVDFVTALQAADITVEVLPIPHAPPISLKTLEIVFRLRTYLRKVKPDMVHTHLYYGELYGTLAARLALVKHVVSTRHSVDAFRKRWYWQWLARRTTRIITISKAVDEFTRTVERVPPQKIAFISYAMPTPEIRARRDALRRELGLSDDTPLIGTVARLTEAKGYPYALQAVAELRQRLPNVHYVIAGDGELRAALEAQAQQLGLEGVVHFLGWRTDTEQVFAALDVFLFPSLWEGLPMALLEAMGYSLPVVSTSTGPMPEVILQGETGFLVPPADAAALVEPLQTLLTHHDLARRMGEAGRERLEQKYSVETMIAQTAALYREIASS